MVVSKLRRYAAALCKTKDELRIQGDARATAAGSLWADSARVMVTEMDPTQWWGRREGHGRFNALIGSVASTAVTLEVLKRKEALSKG